MFEKFYLYFHDLVAHKKIESSNKQVIALILMVAILLIGMVVSVYVEITRDIILQIKLEESQNESNKTISDIYEDSVEAVLIFEKPAEEDSVLDFAHPCLDLEQAKEQKFKIDYNNKASSSLLGPDF